MCEEMISSLDRWISKTTFELKLSAEKEEERTGWSRFTSMGKSSSKGGSL